MLLKVLNFKINKKIAAGSFISVLLIALMVFVWLILSQKTIYKGVELENLILSGLTKSEVQELIEKELDGLVDENKLSLVFEDSVWEISLKDISYGFLIDEAVDRAYSAGREGNIITRLKTIFDLRFKGRSLMVESVYSQQKLYDILMDIKEQIDNKEKDASVVYKNGAPKFEKEVIGKFLEVDKSIGIIENNILERKFSPVELCVQKVTPKVTYDEISHISEVIASFSTTFNPGKQNRSHNIKLACDRINNVLLFPEDVFSMDKTLGPRTIQNGYKDAPVILRNQLVEGVGGGVCQVTTTLYVAVLKACLGVVERTHHSMPLGYVEPGQDATIAEGYIDFKFTNSMDKAVLINAGVVGNRIVVRLIGKKENPHHTVKIKSIIVNETFPGKEDLLVDPSVVDGDRVIDRNPAKGLRVIVYREIYNGSSQLIEREKISDDVYKPVKGRVRVSPNYYRYLIGLEEESSEDES